MRHPYEGQEYKTNALRDTITNRKDIQEIRKSGMTCSEDSHESKSITHLMLSGLSTFLLITLLHLATRISIRQECI